GPAGARRAGRLCGRASLTRGDGGPHRGGPGGPPRAAARARPPPRRGGPPLPPLAGPLGPPDAMVRAWLTGEAQPPIDEYLARAASAPVLEGLGAQAGLPRPPADGGWPRRGGRPQLSYVTESSESLVTPPRRLLCCRCGDSWVHERMTCPGCGERSSAKLPIFADDERFPALRADACETCRRYLISVDGRKDPA